MNYSDVYFLYNCIIGKIIIRKNDIKTPKSKLCTSNEDLIHGIFFQFYFFTLVEEIQFQRYPLQKIKQRISCHTQYTT